MKETEYEDITSPEYMYILIEGSNKTYSYFTTGMCFYSLSEAQKWYGEEQEDVTHKKLIKIKNPFKE